MLKTAPKLKPAYRNATHTSQQQLISLFNFTLIIMIINSLLTTGLVYYGRTSRKQHESNQQQTQAQSFVLTTRIRLI